jgi:HlyD family secretion protein
VKLMPGQPVEILMKTCDRNVISYFTKPLQDHILRAFRER